MQPKLLVQVGKSLTSGHRPEPGFLSEIQATEHEVNFPHRKQKKNTVTPASYKMKLLLADRSDELDRVLIFLAITKKVLAF